MGACILYIFLLYVSSNPFLLHVLKIPVGNNILGTEELVPPPRWFEKPWVDQIRRSCMGRKSESVTSLPASIQWLPLGSNNGSYLFPASTLFLLEHCLPVVPPAMQGFSKELGREVISTKGREKG